MIVAERREFVRRPRDVMDDFPALLSLAKVSY
jgi:hypothetical protein